MKRTKLKANAKLAVPILAIGGGYFIPSWYVIIPLWIIAVIVLAINLWREMDAIAQNNGANAMLIFISMYVIGTVMLPFALAYLLISGILQLLAMTFLWPITAAYTYRKKLKFFFIPLLLNGSIWGLTLNYALVDDWRISLPIYIIGFALLGFTVFHSIKLVQKSKKQWYFTLNGIIVIFSISAALAAVVNPDLVSLDWFGLKLIIWLIKTAINMLIITLITYTVAVISYKLKK